LKAKFGGKNSVLISLESCEMDLFDDKNIDLIPNLQQLRHEWNFYAMEPQEGSHWTSGSLYTAFSGLPCFFNGTGNHIFYGAQKSKLINLGDLLKECGYETYHLSNSAKFAGTKDMLKLFGINHVLDGNFGDKSLPQLSFGGSYDADIFAKAKQILLQRNPEKPFMLWVSTTQFHTPEGAIDERMTPITGKRASALETIAVATDFLLADFLKFIENEDLMRNTVVFIMPDHLFMGHKKIFETGKPRKLWLMTNAEKTDLTIDTTNFYQIDLVKQFLAGAKIEHNAKFLTDIAKGNKDNFIKNSLSEIKTLNMSSLCKENIISESLKIIIRENILYFVVDNEIFIAKNLKLLKNKSIVIQLNNRLEILENKLVGNKKVDAFCSELPYYLRIYVENGTLNLEAAGEHCKKFSVQNCDEISLTRCETAQILGTNTPHF
jgi:hypothetical protein